MSILRFQSSYGYRTREGYAVASVTMKARRWSTWRQAMQRALYDEGGFYRATGAPATAFRTAAHVSPLWPKALLRFARQVDEALGSPPDFAVVDLGAGGGELLTALAAEAPARWSMVGVDVAPRPTSLPDRVGWQPTPSQAVTGLLLAVELLDVVPVDVVELTAVGLRLVEVSDDGEERLGPPPTVEDRAWLDRWWPLADIGDRAEIGRPRDTLWHGFTATITRGVALAVDYAVVPARDRSGTLTAYRHGRQQAPVPDGSCDLTAHVLFESLRDDGDVVVTQREALRTLGISASRPAYDGEPSAYLTALSRAGEAAELTDQHGLGGFSWLLHPVGIDPTSLSVPWPTA
jgi:SAM-dependent MidA family methyltransferase